MKQYLPCLQVLSLTIAERISRLRLVSKLSAGEMGEVFSFCSISFAIWRSMVNFGFKWCHVQTTRNAVSSGQYHLAVAGGSDTRQRSNLQEDE